MSLYKLRYVMKGYLGEKGREIGLEMLNITTHMESARAKNAV